jgi:hypothetical protein
MRPTGQRSRHAERCPPAAAPAPARDGRRHAARQLAPPQASPDGLPRNLPRRVHVPSTTQRPRCRSSSRPAGTPCAPCTPASGARRPGPRCRTARRRSRAPGTSPRRSRAGPKGRASGAMALWPRAQAAEGPNPYMYRYVYMRIEYSMSTRRSAA